MKEYRLKLTEDGDYRSAECISLLRISDMVITNPPFSLIRDFIPRVHRYHVKYLVVGNIQTITGSGIFEIFKAGDMWVGHTKINRFITDSGERSIGCRWYTDIGERTIKPLPEPAGGRVWEYCNFDGVDVPELGNIVNIHGRSMGLSLAAFIEYYDPGKYRIIGLARGRNGKAFGVSMNMSPKLKDMFRADESLRHANTGSVAYKDDKGEYKIPFARVIIQHIGDEIE